MRAKVWFILIVIIFGFLFSMVVHSENSSYDWFFSFIDEDPNSAYGYASDICSITLNVDVSGYSYRVAGSQGEYQVFLYIKNLLSEWGFDVKIHEFDFINWDIEEEPFIKATFGNETTVERIYPLHYTFSTPTEGLNTTIEVLPLPQVFMEGPLPDDIKEVWDKTNISGKIVLVGREVRFNSDWFLEFENKLRKEKPLAVMYTWAIFHNFPMFFSSTGGRRDILKELRLPAFWISRSLADKIIDAWQENSTIRAFVQIPIDERLGKVRNIIASIRGEDTSKTILITAHYDSVMTGGLADNAAGVAGCLELARVLSRAISEGYYTPPINITFVFFTAEEAGLVGSLKFYADNLDFINQSVVGVINLDTLGSFTLEASSTKWPLRFLDGYYYTTDIIKEAAEELGLSITTFRSYIHSDDSTFEYPNMVLSLVEEFWPDFQVDIEDFVFVSGVMIGSYPYVPWEPDEEGRVGWIHTPYDNTTSTEMYDWVNPIRLEKQIKVAGLAILKVLELYEKRAPHGYLISLEQIAIVASTVITAIIIIYVLRRRQRKQSF